MNRIDRFQKLISIGGLSRVISPDGTIDRLIINDPWEVMNPDYVSASRWALLVAAGCAGLALFVSATGLVLGIATNLVVLAMLIRLAAPGATSLPRWNGFTCLGDTSEFDGLPAHYDDVLDGTDDVLHDIQGQYALGYAVWKTAHTPTRNAADTAITAMSNYAEASFAFAALTSIWAMLRTPRAFFVPCMGLGLACVTAVIAKGGEEVERHIVLIGPFSFFTGAILYALTSAKWFRWRIVPQADVLVMHGDAKIEAMINGKVRLACIASAMVPIHVWLLMALIRKFVLGDIDAPIQGINDRFPTPAPSLALLLLGLPFSLISGIVIWSSFGHTTTWTVLLVTYIVPACLGTTSLLAGPSSMEH